MRKIQVLFALLAFSSAVFFLSCNGSVQIEYKDGCFIVTGIPAQIRTVTVRLSAREGTYRQTATVEVINGNSGKICISSVFRRTYQPGEIELVARDESGTVQAEVVNKAAVTLDGTQTQQEIPYSDFGPKP